MADKKTIFIILSQGLLVRNILRTEVLSLLKKRGHKIIIFIQANEIPEYFKEEFLGEQAILIHLKPQQFNIGRLHKKLVLLTHFLLGNKTAKIYFLYSRHYINKPRIEAYFYLLLVWIFSRFKFLKLLIRWIEKKCFPEKDKIIEEYFIKYKPDLVLSTSITSVMDNVFMKAAKRRKIKVISMTKSWDNTTKLYFRFLPDYFLVQNEKLKERIVNLQNFPEDRIYVTGFSQFDWYTQKDIFRTREDHYKKMGLDPKLPLIFFGSQGLWFTKDYILADIIYSWVKNNELVKPCQLLIRPHFTNIKNTTLTKFKNKEKVVYDDSLHISNYFSDNWDPTKPEIIDFANTLYHSDIIVVIYSTIALDAVCFDKPIINALFGAVYRGDKDVTYLMKDLEHYQWIWDTDGTSIAKSPAELKDLINKYLADPKYKAKEREILKNNLCYKVDGKSAERMVAAINSILEINENNGK